MKGQKLVTYCWDSTTISKAVNVVIILSRVSRHFRLQCPGMTRKWGKPAPVLTSVLLLGVAQITAER